MTSLGPELDEARRRVVDRGLTANAIAQLTPVVSNLPLDALAPVKQLLKRFFSTEPWTADDDDALAGAVGAGSGAGRHELEPGLVLVWRWADGRFLLRVRNDLEDTFDGAVVPEATPSPRTIRFATPPLHTGPSRTYASAADASADAGAARLFATFEDVANVLVGPDFVAVTISRPDRWEALLGPMLGVVADEFTEELTSDAEGDRGARRATDRPATITLTTAPDDVSARAPRKLERAWTELGALRGDRPEQLERVLAAARDGEAARRQVAAALLADAPAAIARREWDRLLSDPSRVVRRSVVDSMAGAEREELRPLLERALDDEDAWARWKALRGLAALELGPSRAAVEGRTSDPDFRVRLEAARALRQE